MEHYWVYILSSRNGVLYAGMTNGLKRRVHEHKTGRGSEFTAKYRVDRLVFYDHFPTAIQAIEAEKRIKGWKRFKKVELIEAKNPTWADLSDGWYGPPTPPTSRTIPAAPTPSSEDDDSGGVGPFPRN